MTELEILQDAVRRLEDARVDYMVTGSIGLSYYAQPRMTRDVDYLRRWAPVRLRIVGGVTR